MNGHLTGPECPECGYPVTVLEELVAVAGREAETRECADCGHRFSIEIETAQP